MLFLSGILLLQIKQLMIAKIFNKKKFLLHSGLIRFYILLFKAFKKLNVHLSILIKIFRLYIYLFFNKLRYFLISWTVFKTRLLNKQAGLKIKKTHIRSILLKKLLKTQVCVKILFQILWINLRILRTVFMTVV